MKKPKLSELTLREKIGQMLLPYQYYVYYDDIGTYPDNMRSEQEVANYIGKEQFGSYYAEQTAIHRVQHPNLAESGNTKVDTASYKDFLKKQSDMGKIPAMMAGDWETEGAGYIFSDLSTTCKPLAMGATDSEELVFELSRCIAKELRTAGVSWRWAPAVDIANRYNLCFMRTYAPDDPDKIIRLSNAQIRGTQAEGVAATAKHFPGQDRYDYRDSHFSPAINSSDMDEWWREQGKIFKGIIDGGVYSVMIGHHAFPACDNSKLKGRYRPSTVSKKIITDLLKGELGFNGVVITDGLTMAGLTGCYDTYEELIIDLVNAGNDCLLGSLPEAGDIIEKAVADGVILESRIDDACSRMLDMKEKLGMFEEDYWFPPYKAEDVVPETQKVNREIAKRAITLVRDTQNLLPVDKSKVKNVTIVCSSHTDAFFAQLEHMKKAFEDRGMKVRLQRRVANAAEMKEIDQSSDLIIYAAWVAPHQPRGHMGLYGEECGTYMWAFSEGQKKSIGLSMGYPYIHYDFMGNAETFINAYGSSPELMDAFVEAIFGEAEITGVSPVKLEPDPLIL